MQRSTNNRTIALAPGGTIKLAGPAPLDMDKIKSEKKLEDEELLKLIAAPLRAGKTKKKKAAAGADVASADSALQAEN